MNALSARQSALAPAARSAGVRGLSSSANIAGAALPRRSAAAAAPRRLSVLQAAPRASYDASSYGPVGGDARIKVSDQGACPAAPASLAAPIAHQRPPRSPPQVIGVGGGGGNAVNRMISSGLAVRLAQHPAPPAAIGR